jgi:hypothetical protein
MGVLMSALVWNAGYCNYLFSDFSLYIMYVMYDLCALGVVLECWKILLFKLRVDQLVKNHFTFYETRTLFLCSQEPATDPCVETDEFNSRSHVLFL